MSRFPQAEFTLSVAAPAQFPQDVGAEVAFAGRSNAGKSSALNALCERNALARTSKLPGRTRLLNYFDLGAGRRIVDLPGYGFAKVSDAERRQWVMLIDALRGRASLAGLMLIIDSRRGVLEEDLEFVAWADPSRLPVHVLLAKSDKLKQAEKSKALRDAKKALSTDVGVHLFSAHGGEGVREAQNALIGMLKKETPVE